jgi:uncharacterized membrane protein
MGVLIAGLVVFLGVHSLRLLGVRDALHARLGRSAFMGLYSLVSVIGLGLIVWGFGLARPSELLWTPPEAARWIAFGTVPLALILTLAAYLPGVIRARLRHPMIIGVLISMFTAITLSREMLRWVIRQPRARRAWSRSAGWTPARAMSTPRSRSPSPPISRA